ncbi:MAG: hypothetical protein FJW14_07310 [Acidimicrobiia bacterium]|nr:hypothetical protein [Acidimicrobiia bacterium]
MVRLTPRRRTVVVETLRELANLVVGAVVLGRFVAEGSWSLGLVTGGVVLWLVLLGFALILAEERTDG